jgi:hypothetical protein
MIPREALLSNEDYCKRCGGEGDVPSIDSRVSTVATQPRFTGMIECPAGCANGIVATERRDRHELRAIIESCHRQEIIDHLREAEKVEIALVAQVNERDLTINVQLRLICALSAENKRFRAAIDKAAEVIVRRASQARP